MVDSLDNAKSNKKTMSQSQKENLIARMTKEMKKAASELDFERAAYLRDSIAQIKNSEK